MAIKKVFIDEDEATGLQCKSTPEGTLVFTITDQMNNTKFMMVELNEPEAREFLKHVENELGDL